MRRLLKVSVMVLVSEDGIGQRVVTVTRVSAHLFALLADHGLDLVDEDRRQGRGMGGGMMEGKWKNVPRFSRRRTSARDQLRH